MRESVMSPENPSQTAAPRHVDAHAHILEEPEIAAAMIHHCEGLGIGAFFLGGYDPDDWDRQLRLREKFGNRIQMSFGLHPWFVHNASGEVCREAFHKLESRLTTRPGHTGMMPSAIGETGLDHALATDKQDRERQLDWFRRHLRLAGKLGMPVVLHVVKAHGACLRELHAHPGTTGLVHAFRGEKNLIVEYARLGMLLSIGPNGVAGMSRENLATIPDRILVIESDAPTGAIGARERGSSQIKPAHITPAVIIEVAEKVALARGKGETAGAILDLSRENLSRVFQIAVPG